MRSVEELLDGLFVVEHAAGTPVEEDYECLLPITEEEYAKEYL